MGSEVACRERTRYPTASEAQELNCEMDLLLDTSVLIDTLLSYNRRKQLLARLVEEGHRLTATALNIAGIYAGIRSGEGNANFLVAGFIGLLCPRL